ncbi:MAG: DNA mismatch repair protein MutS [Planctomycetota bacterium]
MANKTLTPPKTKRPQASEAVEVDETDAPAPDAEAADPEAPDPSDATPVGDDEPNLFQRPPAASATTPLMQQYLELKERHAHDVLLFRMGDFYEMFYEDARTTARVLGIVQTRRSPGPNAYAMAGFPHHALDRYLPRLIAAGLSVAIAEQVEDPALAKGRRIVRREVIEVITPGTLADASLLSEERANFLLALHVPKARTKPCGLAWFEVSSGRFFVCEVERERLEAEVERIEPAEVVVADGFLRRAEQDDTGPEAELVRGLQARAPVASVPDYVLRPQGALEALKGRYGIATFAGMGLDDQGAYLAAAHAALHYVGEKKPGFLETLGSSPGIQLWRPEQHVCLDPATARCLEITRPLREATGVQGTLFGAIDRTRTAMGRRLLREWLQGPLKDVPAIRARQDAVEALVACPKGLEALQGALSEVYDLERLTGLLARGRGGPRDLAALRDSLRRLPRVREALELALAGHPGGVLRGLHQSLDPLGPVCDELSRALVERPAAAPKDGEVIAPGFDPELDELRGVSGNMAEALARFQAQEVERTGIPSLKVGYNKVFGYYLEVTQAHKAKVPERYVRKQTLKHCERFLTPELKELEEKVLSAAERREQLEAELIASLRDRVAERSLELHASARATAELDVLGSLARLAKERGYVRPEVDDTEELEVVDGRHPVLDLTVKRFVPNGVRFGEEPGRIHVITGPNMAGKSTYIRQVALLVLLAQTGSFVPAARARIGVADRIFARLGSGDELAQGLSTFMVEMTEAANILRHASPKSLVILDEVGRGTSTYDGVSLAWAIAEYLHDKVRARTLFATHYHELTGLAGVRAGANNLSIAVAEEDGDVTFLHRVVEGSADRSYGIHVARLAGVPSRVLTRAQVILRQLESGTFDAAGAMHSAEAPLPESPKKQLGLFPVVPEDELRERLRALEVESTTPLEALNLLAELKQLAAE